MNSHRLHRLIGIILLVPLCIWSITGAIFITKPGYKNAYLKLPIQSYPLQEFVTLDNSGDWFETRQLRTILGHHILVRNNNGWQQLDPKNLTTRSAPSNEQLIALINDAIQINPERYGELLTFHQDSATTNTGVTITLDWNTLKLQQRGRDTESISKLYQLHYLKWTGNNLFDTIIAIIGLGLLLILTILGAVMCLKKPHRNQ